MNEQEEQSKKERLTALLLCVFLSVLGIHRFYVGKIVTGILWALTGGFLGLGLIIDCLMILTGNFKDSEGKRVLDRRVKYTGI